MIYQTEYPMLWPCEDAKRGLCEAPDDHNPTCPVGTKLDLAVDRAKDADQVVEVRTYIGNELVGMAYPGNLLVTSEGYARGIRIAQIREAVQAFHKHEQER